MNVLISEWLGNGKSSGPGVKCGCSPTFYQQPCEQTEVTPNLCPSHVKWEHWINQQPIIDKVQWTGWSLFGRQRGVNPARSDVPGCSQEWGLSTDWVPRTKWVIFPSMISVSGNLVKRGTKVTWKWIYSRKPLALAGHSACCRMSLSLWEKKWDSWKSYMAEDKSRILERRYSSGGLCLCKGANALSMHFVGF